MTHPNTAPGIWFAAGVAGVGLIMVALGVKILVDVRRQRRSWVIRPGRVIDSQLGTFGRGIQFQVAFENDGEEVTFWNRFVSGSGVDPVGKAVQVRVNPRNPSDAVVVKGVAARGTITAVVFLLLGSVITAVGAMLAAAASN